jgi:antitoxin component of MazEF toxin-antitoxin module
MISSARMRERKAELDKRYNENRPGEDRKEILNITNELLDEIAQLDSTNWFIESHNINGSGCQIAEGENSQHDGPARIIGKITEQKDADRVVILQNEAILAIEMLRYDLADAAMCLNGKVKQSLMDSFDASIANADDVLSRLK